MNIEMGWESFMENGKYAERLKIELIKPKTNYEKIMSMTIDEMAVLLQHIIPCEICKNEDCSQSCNDGIKQWLKARTDNE